VALFSVRSLRSWMRWWSLPIFIGGFITLSIGIASLTLFGWAWGKYVVPTILSSVGPTLSKLGRGLAQSLVNDFAPWLMLESRLLTLLALGLLLGSARLPPPATARPAWNTRRSCFEATEIKTQTQRQVRAVFQTS